MRIPRHYRIRRNSHGARKLRLRRSHRHWRRLRHPHRCLDAMILYCAGVPPGSPYLDPEAAITLRARGVTILIAGAMNGFAWGYATLWVSRSWVLATVLGLAMTALVIHLDQFLTGGGGGPGSLPPASGPSEKQP